MNNSFSTDILQLIKENSNSKSLVFYRLPNTNKVNYIVGKANEVNSVGAVLTQKGFAFIPAINSKQHVPYFISPEQEGVVDNIESLNVPITEWPIGATEPIITSHHDYLNNVMGMVWEIQAHKLEKAILSRIKSIPTTSFNPWETFKKLCAKYPSVMVYWASIPKVGTWIGATPETLIHIEHGESQTVALAGTQPDSGVAYDKVQWGDKEKNEQQIVSDNIKQLIAAHFPEAKVDIDGPKTISTGALLHLKTSFGWNSGTNIDSIGAFIDSLHPTPAILGQPREAALTLINNTELHDRAYYTGLLGPINPKGLTHLFVNLRCMQVYKDFLALYLGGGITSESKPSAEWQETELKANTLLSTL